MMFLPVSPRGPSAPIGRRPHSTIRIAVELEAAQPSRRKRGASGRLTGMSNGKSVSPIGYWPNDFVGFGNGESQEGGAWRLNERRGTETTAAMAGVAAVAGVAGDLIRRTIVGANNCERIKGCSRRHRLDQADATDDRLQRERIRGDPADSLPPFAPCASAHREAPPDEFITCRIDPAKFRIFASARRCGYHRAVPPEHGHDHEACRCRVYRSPSRRHACDSGAILAQRPWRRLARNPLRHLPAGELDRPSGGGPGGR